MSDGYVRKRVAPAGIGERDWQELLARLPSADAATWGVDEVIDNQKTIDDWYAGRPHDGLYWFNQFYLRVTEGVQQEIKRARQRVPSSEFLRRLDVEFYARYLNALRGHGSPAWDPLFDDSDKPRREPIQWALQGVHAHIIGDLPPAIVKALRAVQSAAFPAPKSSEHRTFTQVNLVLYRVAAREFKQNGFAPGVKGVVHAILPRLVDHLVDVYVKVLREGAWVQAQLLWDVQDGSEFEAADIRLGTFAAWYTRQLTNSFPLAPLDFRVVSGWFSDRTAA